MSRGLLSCLAPGEPNVQKDDEDHKTSEMRERPQCGRKQRMKQDGFAGRCGRNDHGPSPLHLPQALQESLLHAAFEVVDSHGVRKVASVLSQKKHK